MLCELIPVFGKLRLEELVPPSGPRDRPAVRGQLDRLVHRQQDLAYGPSAEALAAEAVAAGFQDARITESPLGRLVTTRKPPAERTVSGDPAVA